MPKVLPVDNQKKLNVTYRVEAGCLGPNGVQFIAEFCAFAQAEFQLAESDYIVWNIIHRSDKTLPEIQYGLVGKVIDEHKAGKYLAVFGKALDDFETHITDQLATLISQYMNGRL